MKQKLLFLLTALMLLTTGNAWGGIVVLYSQDFNAETVIPAGWTQASGTLSLESNGGNKWLRETTAGSGSRTAWYTGTAIKDAIGAYTSYTLEFDCLIKEGTNTTNYAQGVWVLGSNLAQSWGTPTSPAIGLMKGSNEATYTISANAAATAEKVNLTSNTWYHYVCAYDHSTKKITFSILSADKSSTIYAAKTFDYDYSADGKGVFQSIAFQAGRGSGYTEIDNILLTTEVNEEFVSTPSIAVAYAGENRTVTITPGVSSESNVVTTYYTLNGEDPTSSSNVYSTPLDIDADCTVKAISISSASVASAITGQAVTVGTLKLNAPTFTKTGYAAGKYTVSMASNQSSLAFPPASYTNYYSIDGGTAEAYSAPFELSEGSTVTGYVVATNYTNSDETNLTSAVRPILSEVWSIDFAGQATEDKGGVTIGAEAFTASGVSFGNITSAGLTSNDNFGVKTGTSWLLRNGSRGLYSQNGSGTPVGVQGLKAGQYIKMVVDLTGLYVSDAASLVDDMSTVTEKYIVVNSDGNANINFDRYGYIKSIAVCDEITPVQLAIADCKQHETSAAFAAAIDAESFETAAEVYAFHTAWQVKNASSKEITKVIFDAQVSDFSRWNNARNNHDQQYDGAPDNKYFDAWNNEASDGKQKIYGLPAGTYTLKAATRASDDVDDVDKYKVWVKGGSADVSVLGHHDGNTGGELGNGWSWTTLTFTLDATADVEIGFYSCPPTERWTGCDDFHLYAEGVSASLGTNGYATFASPYALDLANLPEGLTAYKAAVEETTVTFTQVTEAVQANTGLLLKGSASGNYDIPVAASGTDISATNAFLVNTNGIDKESGYTYYGLLKNTLTFATFDPASVTIPSNKAYLKVANNPSARLVVRFDEEDPTAINAVEAAETEGGALKDGKYLIGNKIVLVKNGVKYGANGQKLN